MTILIAFDGSDDARTAIEFAARTLRPAPVVVLTVWEPLLSQINWAPLAAAGALTVDTKTDEWPEEEQARQLALAGAELARKAGFETVEARSARTTGPIWAGIVDVADELDADVIVTGSRGLAGARSVILGSVSTRVLHHTHRATLVVPHAKQD
ncbi:universal stress protein [Actinomadura rupiterrae]|uniref:universal stress protein n=1 Tax=Actinomadura rupiterrae TaxID=559627 RepID=UPI0020A4F827|nr:universal stress protein [Actinomadura rupiterrae]MCP2337212.1 nucleotide-binding universal stress UspA family protein [Actinomadura rupiterrae]